MKPLVCLLPLLLLGCVCAPAPQFTREQITLAAADQALAQTYELRQMLTNWEREERAALAQVDGATKFVKQMLLCVDNAVADAEWARQKYAAQADSDTGQSLDLALRVMLRELALAVQFVEEDWR